MNMVNSIYAHVSLGYPVEIILTRIIMLSNQVERIDFICKFYLFLFIVGFSNGIKIT